MQLERGGKDVDHPKDWFRRGLENVPDIKVKPPGARSIELYERAKRYTGGFSSQVRLFPVVYESGYGMTLRDVDGNTYIDFSSGIYVTNCGHSHPKITEAIQKQAAILVNSHDYVTKVKVELLEKLAKITPEGMGAAQLYSTGSEAVEAGLRVMRAATGKFEFISFFGCFHGKTMGANSLAGMNGGIAGPRASGYHRAPYANC